MIHLGWLQFKYSQKTWFNAIFTFVASGWLLGFCSIGLFSLSQTATATFNSSHDPSPLFSAPLVLGVFTLFFSIRGIIKAVIDSFNKDYRLWHILGATDIQISLLVAIQVSLLSIVGGSIGFFLALLSVSPMYLTLQSWIGELWLPTINFYFIVPFIITITSLILTSGLSGYTFTHKSINKKSNTIVKNIRMVFKGLILIAVLCALAINIYHIFHINSSENLLDSGAVLLSSSMYLILLQIFTKNQAFKYLLKLLFNLTPIHKNGYLNVANWESVANFDRIGYTLVPVLVVETLTMGIIELLFGFSNQVDFQNALVSFLIYIFAPELIVIINVISMTKLSSQKYKRQLAQLNLVGFNYQGLIYERIIENFFYSLALFLYSFVSCSFTYFLLIIITMRAHSNFSILSQMVWILPFLTSIIVFVLLSITDLFTFKSWQHQQ